MKELKREANEEKSLVEDEFDIFGGISQDTTKVSGIKNQKACLHISVSKLFISFCKIVYPF